MIKLIENHKNINYQTLKISNMINKYKIIISINKFLRTTNIQDKNLILIKTILNENLICP